MMMGLRSPWRGSAGLLTFVALLWSAGCAAHPEPAEHPSARTHPVDALIALPRAAWSSRVEVVARLGPPDRVAARSVANLHVPGQVDSIVHLHYPGLDIAFYAVTEPARDLLGGVVLSAGGYLDGERVRIGSSAGEVEAALGPPDGAENGWWTFVSRAEGADESVSLHVADVGVDSIRWSFYVD